VDMDLSSTQQSPSIFSLDAMIIPIVLVLPSFVILILFYSNLALLRSLHNKIFQNSHWLLN